MSYLLDTNVISELRKPVAVADATVRTWMSARRPSSLFLSVVTILELEVGIARVERRDSHQGKRLRTWLEDSVMDVFAGRILDIDLAVVRRCAHLHVPDPRPERDALIAATASEHAMSVVTRNIRDFAPMGVATIDPWQPE